MPSGKEELITLKEDLKKTKEDLFGLEGYIEEFSLFLPLAVCTVNPLHIITNINKAFEELTGFSINESIGEALEEIFKKDSKVKNIIKEIGKKKKTLETELTLITKKKKEIPVKVSFSARKDNEGNFIGYFTAIDEIVELKKFQKGMEEKVKELEDSRKALFNILEDIEEARGVAEDEKNKTLAIITNFTDGLLFFDTNNRLSLVNSQAKKFLKVNKEKILKKPILELEKFGNFKSLIKILTEEDKDIFRIEFSPRKGLALELSRVSISGEEEKIGELVILHDISRDKLIERMKTEFVSLAAHQLRTPLSAIKWTLKMLLDGDLGKVTKEQKEFIEKTYNSNERMIDLINSLLNVTRIEEGRYLYKPTLTSLENIVQFVINSCENQLERKNIKLNYKKPDKKLPQVKVDIEKIRLAIQNLFDNAIRYTPKGGQVTVSLKHDKKEIEFSIADTGVGVPEDQQSRVFSKFFRGANVIRLDTEGSGLGLFITKNIIEAHGGRIWFDSKEGKGTTFYIAFPIKKEFEEFLKKF